MKRLPKNYKKMLDDFQIICQEKTIFIDSMMFAKGKDYFGYVPHKEFVKSECNWTEKEQVAITQECYEKLSDVAERHHLELLLAHFILPNGATMLMGCAEMVTKHLDKIKMEGK